MLRESDKCLFCRRFLPTGRDAIKAHLLECVEAYRTSHPEVADVDQLEIEMLETKRLESSLDGCENLAPRNLGNEEVE